MQNLPSSHLLSKNVKIRIHRTIILPVVLNVYKTWSLTLREEHRLRVFDLGEVEWGDVDWIDLARDWNRWRAPVNMVLNHHVR
jgi:hypothetical protein